MSKLEALLPNSTVKGILPDSLVALVTILNGSAPPQLS